MTKHINNRIDAFNAGRLYKFTSNLKPAKVSSDIVKLTADHLELPCDNCITLAICQNKLDIDLIFCPLLDPYFKNQSRKLSFIGKAIGSNRPAKIALDLTSLNITIQLHKVSSKLMYIDVIKHDYLVPTCRRFEL